MQHYVGLDVSVNETSVCIVDKAGKVIREVKVATEPVAILAAPAGNLTCRALSSMCALPSWPLRSEPRILGFLHSELKRILPNAIWTTAGIGRHQIEFMC